jgi:hypothetical protein
MFAPLAQHLAVSLLINKRGLSPLFLFPAPVSQRLTAMCCAKGARARSSVQDRPTGWQPVVRREIRKFGKTDKILN